ncbi:hypothetical protein DL98DRAFT_513983 [Cadophora sp. DSE1049]|nr:hypothetical protein DL98DRAFT_513983 [Cadophora sp. DSE1049]
MVLKFPPIYILKNGFESDPDLLHKIEEQLGNVKYDVNETKLFIGVSTTKGRIAYELRKLGLYTADATRDLSTPLDDGNDGAGTYGKSSKPPKKRRKATTHEDGKEVISLSTDSDTPPTSDTESHMETSSPKRARNAPRKSHASSKAHDNDAVKVYKLEWFEDSVKAKKLLPREPYLVYEGRIVSKPIQRAAGSTQLANRTSIMSRARADTPPPASQRSYGHRHKKTNSQTAPILYQEDTADHEHEEDLPKLPDYLRTTYSCQRPTPMHGPNDEFIRLLKIIKKARIIDEEEKRRHTYHSAIASLTAYPFTITSRGEIIRLPCCGEKFANLWYEWSKTGRIQEVEDILKDPRMTILNIFYDIYDVAATTAVKFYNNGWTDLDDVVQYGW